MTFDKMFIKGLRVEAIIGVHDWEREIRQALFIDVVMATDIRPAAEIDELALALNYQAVCDFVRHLVATSNFKLIETLAETIAGSLQSEFAIDWLQVSVHKPGAIADADDIGVTIERGYLG
jgi:dihydroneopterin aldolase